MLRFLVLYMLLYWILLLYKYVYNKYLRLSQKLSLSFTDHKTLHSADETVPSCGLKRGHLGNRGT